MEPNENCAVHFLNDDAFEALTWQDQIGKAICIGLLDGAKDYEILDKQDKNGSTSGILWTRNEEKDGEKKSFLVGFSIKRPIVDVLNVLDKMAKRSQHHIGDYLMDAEEKKEG